MIYARSRVEPVALTTRRIEPDLSGRREHATPLEGLKANFFECLGGNSVAEPLFDAVSGAARETSSQRVTTQQFDDGASELRCRVLPHEVFASGNI